MNQKIRLEVSSQCKMSRRKSEFFLQKNQLQSEEDKKLYLQQENDYLKHQNEQLEYEVNQNKLMYTFHIEDLQKKYDFIQKQEYRYKQALLEYKSVIRLTGVQEQELQLKDSPDFFQQKLMDSLKQNQKLSEVEQQNEQLKQELAMLQDSYENLRNFMISQDQIQLLDTNLQVKQLQGEISALNRKLATEDKKYQIEVLQTSQKQTNESKQKIEDLETFIKKIKLQHQKDLEDLREQLNIQKNEQKNNFLQMEDCKHLNQTLLFQNDKMQNDIEKLMHQISVQDQMIQNQNIQYEQHIQKIDKELDKKEQDNIQLEIKNINQHFIQQQQEHQQSYTTPSEHFYLLSQFSQLNQSKIFQKKSLFNKKSLMEKTETQHYFPQFQLPQDLSNGSISTNNQNNTMMRPSQIDVVKKYQSNFLIDLDQIDEQEVQSVEFSKKESKKRDFSFNGNENFESQNLKKQSSNFNGSEQINQVQQRKSESQNIYLEIQFLNQESMTLKNLNKEPFTQVFSVPQSNNEISRRNSIMSEKQSTFTQKQSITEKNWYRKYNFKLFTIKNILNQLRFEQKMDQKPLKAQLLEVVESLNLDLNVHNRKIQLQFLNQTLFKLNCYQYQRLKEKNLLNFEVNSFKVIKFHNVFSLKLSDNQIKKSWSFDIRFSRIYDYFAKFLKPQKLPKKKAFFMNFSEEFRKKRLSELNIFFEECINDLKMYETGILHDFIYDNIDKLSLDQNTFPCDIEKLVIEKDFDKLNEENYDDIAFTLSQKLQNLCNDYRKLEQLHVFQE